MALRSAATAKILHVCSAVFVLVGLAVLLNWTFHTKQLLAATTHQPERFTELYFANANRLPTSAQSGQNLAIDFVAHNVEARPMAYTANLEFSDSSAPTVVLAQQQFSLASGQARAVISNVKLPSFSGRAEISVMLVNQPEAIHFWVEAAP